jgi:hypothetical protein
MKNHEFQTKFKMSNGEEVDIVIDEDANKVNVFNQKEEEIGSIDYRIIDNEHYEYIRLTHMSLDIEYVRKGIGRECLKLLKEYGLPVTAAYDDGIRKDDGSHLTGDAVYFIQTMRNEGLVCE